MNRHFCAKCGKPNFYETSLPSLCGFCGNSFAGTSFKAQAASLVASESPFVPPRTRPTPNRQEPPRRYRDDDYEYENLDYSGLQGFELEEEYVDPIVLKARKRRGGVTLSELSNESDEGNLRIPRGTYKKKSLKAILADLSEEAGVSGPRKAHQSVPDLGE